MARSKEFDVDEALERALEVFWRHGYEATSMQQLVDAMGVQRASLYATFGDKHALYLRALTRYQQRAEQQIAEQLAAAPSPRQALIDLLDRTAGTAGSQKGRKGCFCVNASVEVQGSDRELGALLRAHGERVEALFTAALRRSRQLGELDRGASPAALATVLHGLLVAIQVLARQGAAKDRARTLVEHAVRLLGA